jgi:hypothetical protein
MTSAATECRYSMVHVRPGHVVVEHDLLSRSVRSYFSDEAVAPVEEYREGKRIWQYAGTAQSFQFDVKDDATGDVVPFRELLGLMYYGCAKPESDLHRLGHIAHDNNISIYVAVTYESKDGEHTLLSEDKLRVLNRLFNDRLRTPGKKILILPDLFDLYKTMSYGEIMIDFGLTSMEEER